MAEIDVSDVLEDPEFLDSIIIIRQSESVNTHGRSVDTAAPQVSVLAVVQAASKSTLMMLPDLARSPGNIEVWVEYNLQTETDTTAPDIVVWRGEHYAVSQVMDWSNWGQGYVHAVCTRREQVDTSTPL